MAFVSLTAMSCKDSKKEDIDEDAMHSEMNEDAHHDDSDGPR